MKKVFVTGVTSDLGREVVKQLLSFKYEIWGIGRNQEKLNALSREFKAINLQSCDLKEESSMRDVMARMKKKEFEPDILLLLAGIYPDESLPELDHNILMDSMYTNLHGSYFWIAAFLKQFLKKRTGQVIVLGSYYSKWPDDQRPAYSASKSALDMIVRSLRIRYKKSGIHFKVIYCGPILKEEDKKSWFKIDNNKAARRICESIHLKRRNTYIPGITRFVMKFLLWLPDNTFQKLTKSYRPKNMQITR